MSSHYDYLIIGGGIAGFTAAETVRAKDEKSTIGIVNDEPYILYSKVLLPSYLKKRIRREQLFLRTLEQMAAKKIDMFLGQEVVSIDTSRQEVNLSNGDFLGYEKLLIASGGKVRPWPGENQDMIYRLHNMDDGDKIFNNLEKIKNPLVVGGSFIGLEFLEIFVVNKTPPTLLLEHNHFFHHLVDEKGAELLHNNFKNHGIETRTDEKISNVSKSPAGEAVILTSKNNQLSADALAVGIGIDRNKNFLEKSSIKVGVKGIQTNEFLETNAPNVWAAGDVAEFYDPFLGKYNLSGNWTSAFLQGQVVGTNMLGFKKEFKSISTYSINNLGFQITALGDCDSALDTVVRYDQYRKLYERFFIKGDALVGAVLINQFKDKAILTKLIESKTPIGGYLDKMQSFDFDLAGVPVIN